MSNIGEYRSVMFNEIETVELVDKTDPEYTQWKKKIYSKTTPAQKRREKEIKDHQDFFKKFKEIWLSNEYENIKVKNYCFKNCAKFIPRKTYYSKEEYVIDMLKESCRSGKIPTAFFNDFYKDFFQISESFQNSF